MVYNIYTLILALSAIFGMSMPAYAADDTVTVGAARTSEYLPLLEGKRVGLYTNHTGMIDSSTHTLDAMLAAGIDVECVFAPEHGFRGTADAGEHVAGGIDQKTGVKIVSLYGPGRAEAMEKAMQDLDIVVTDIQDVGLRYYTYYCTMLELMNSAAAHGKKFMVLDRPNPNGMYVDGPILDMKYESGVGRLPIPVVHGLTLGEMARMINGEGWLKQGRTVDLTVVPCAGYTHATRYELPIAPSPNLPDMTSIYLYPSICYFEATDVSLGRGTEKPFKIYGHPRMKGRSFSFTPTSRPGAKNPPQKGVKCYGVDLSDMPHDSIIARGIDLSYLIDAYRGTAPHKERFLTSFFEKLIGVDYVRQMIADGASADEIKARWAGDVADFKIRRRPYLLYAE